MSSKKVVEFQRWLKLLLLGVLLIHYLWQNFSPVISTNISTIYPWDYILQGYDRAENRFYQMILMTVVFAVISYGSLKKNSFILILSAVFLGVFALGIPVEFLTWFVFIVEISLILLLSYFYLNPEERPAETSSHT